jgi:hypothetical protein
MAISGGQARSALPVIHKRDNKTPAASSAGHFAIVMESG